ncbi:ribonuclease R [Marinomonas sp. PE14-40]|uniref:ribonuclease R n=1 Tax=Marinomonas sp. PE14-40 TaxID=3060621 RepID=UPI003F67BB4B
MSKKTNKEQNTIDPFQAREASKYENPVPSREYILEFLASENKAFSHPALCDAFNLTGEDEIEALRRRLIAMARDHQASCINNEYSPLAQDDFHEGYIQGNKEGHGFLLRDDADDIFISARQMQLVMDGDKVRVRPSGRTVRGRLDGVIVEVLEHKHARLVGRYYKESQAEFVTPENPRLSQDILLAKDTGLHPGHGQYVVIEITEYADKRNAAKGVITQILGDFMAPGLEIDVALHRYEVPHEWPDAVIKQVKNIGEEVEEEDKVNRVDLRDRPFVTIDGEDARDFDDAVMCEKTPGGWKLYVAIADVSHYVKKGSALDAEAIVRGNSVYFPGRVIPMLPEALSNGLCSLNPDVDRLAMVAEISLTSRGKMRSYKFYEGLIRSHARLTYTKVAHMIAEPVEGEREPQAQALRERYADIVSHIDDLAGLYQVLRQARDERGALEFDTVETRMVFDQFSKIDQIVPVERNDAHKLIEECMLCANVATAEFLLKSGLPALFRIHEGPKEEKLIALRDYLSVLGLSIGGGLKPTPDDYATLSADIQGRSDARSIQTMILRSMSQAVYSPDNVGHFGLNYDAYTHFTSPIRRYPDLLVHRAIRYLIRGEGRPKLRQAIRVAGSEELKAKKIYGYDDADMDGFGDSCSITERRADEATRDVEAWLKCQYVEQHLGEEFDGVITAVTPFGIFVELQNLFVDGLVHISALGNDYFHHDPEMQVIVGERTAKVFRLGDRLKVTVAQVNLEQRKIDLAIVSEKKAPRAAKQKQSDLSELEMQLAQLPPMELGAPSRPSKPSETLTEKQPKQEGESTEGGADKANSKKRHKKKSVSKGKRIRQKKTDTANKGAKPAKKPKSAAAKKISAIKKAKKKGKKSNAKARSQD